LGRLRLRQLDISNGCQDHTTSPYANSVVRLVRRSIAHGSLIRPAIPCAPTLTRPPHPIPRS
jgi:hypothetical protein